MERVYTILVVEDNEINREILDEMLCEEYDLLFAQNGEEGMAQLHKHYQRIDMVLLDIQMPLMNGYEVLEAMQKEPLLKDIPVIVTTGNDDQQDEIRCLWLGATDFVRKPYAPAVVRLRISSILRLRESTEANRQKTLFIQNISHEIRTPMNAIMGFSGIMSDENCELSREEQVEYCGLINQNSHALMDMIENMMLLSDFDGNTVRVKMEEVDINNLCRGALKKTQRYHPQGVQVSFSSEVDDDTRVYTSQKLLQHAVINHVTNACKFTQEGEIELHCRIKEQPHLLEVSVRDTGRGVPPADAEKIYERFCKLDYFVPGAGVGLSVSRTIAKYLEGRSYLDTSYKGGARFVLEIPLRRE